MALTDAEKQTRFRMKEDLKRAADKAFRQLQLSAGFHHDQRSPQQLKADLDQIADLPSGWTEDDYKRAFNRIQFYLHNIISMPDQVKNDFEEGTNKSRRFMASEDPRGFLAEDSKALKKTRDLAAHLVSALKLSDCNEAEKAAAVMEAVREVGKALMNLNEYPESDATAMCFASLGPHYPRPTWFPERFATVIKKQLDPTPGGPFYQALEMIGGPRVSTNKE